MLSEQMIHNIVDGSRSAIGNKLLAVVLYGSMARGDGSPESDIDVALFISSALNSREHDAMVTHYSDLCLDYDRVFSPIEIEQGKYNQWVDILPFYQNIRKEGIILWKAA